MAVKHILICAALFVLLKSGYCLREEECVEVGFARSSFVVVEQSYEAAKEPLIEAWKIEDKTKIPSYYAMSEQMKNVTRAAKLLEETSQNILQKIRKTRVGKRCPEEHLLVGVEKHVTPLIQIDKEFAEDLGLVMSFRCLVGSPYPNVDGTCVHDQGPDMGANGAKFLRLIPPVSGKGGFSLRGSSNNEKELPSSREVSRLIRRHLKRPRVSVLFSEFGHFVARDTFSIPESPWIEKVDCCEDASHPDCEPIQILEGDTLVHSQKCINYKRSAPAQAILGHREAFSSVSTYLDATPVYGSTNEEAFAKKTSYFGFLKSPEPNDDEKMKEMKMKKCAFPTTFKDCFNVDDNGENFVQDLDMLLTLEHNKISEQLAIINPHFDDALLYNEARRTLIAEYNNILYGEYLPTLLGRDVVEKHSLLPGAEGPGASFITEVNPGILTSFALAAYWNPSMTTEWQDHWGPTNFLNSMHYQSIRKDLYQDMLTHDVQRGRDHGLPGYNIWRRFCDNGKGLDSWNDYEGNLDKPAVEEIKELYNDEIGDPDLLVSLLENPEEGAIVGKTAICILADQFARLRTGNKLYWEHETSLLTNEQKTSIRATTAGALLCRHLAIEFIAKNPFLPISESNPEVKCNTFTEFDMAPWKDTSLIEVMKKAKEEEKDKEAEEEEVVAEKNEEDIKQSNQKQEILPTESKYVDGATRTITIEETVTVSADGKSLEQGQTMVPDKIHKSEL